MPDIKAVLSEEIRRLARKEVKAFHEGSKDTASAQKKELSALKRQVKDLEKQVARLSKAKPAAAASKVSAEADDDSQARFSPAWLAKHREKLELSAADYAKLVGCSALSIYKWEKGESNPRRAQRAALAAIRGIGKREALSRLEALEGEEEDSAAA